jgi:hypothetical protein
MDISAVGSIPGNVTSPTTAQGVAPIYSLNADQMTLGTSPVRANADSSMASFGVGTNVNTYG